MVESAAMWVTSFFRVRANLLNKAKVEDLFYILRSHTSPFCKLHHTLLYQRMKKSSRPLGHNVCVRTAGGARVSPLPLGGTNANYIFLKAIFF